MDLATRKKRLLQAGLWVLIALTIWIGVKAWLAYREYECARYCLEKDMGHSYSAPMILHKFRTKRFREYMQTGIYKFVEQEECSCYESEEQDAYENKAAVTP